AACSRVSCWEWGPDVQERRGGRDRRLLGCVRRQRTLDGVPDELMNRARIAKAHFGLLRVNIDVDAARHARQPERVSGLPVVMQDVPVRFAQRMREHAVAYV